MVRPPVSAVVVSAIAALAANLPPPVPLDAQIGQLNFPVTCEILDFVNQTFKTVFTATAPVYGGSGQEIYYTDVVGNVEIPSSITDLAPLASVTQAQANVTVYLNLQNASPANFLAFQVRTGIHSHTESTARISDPFAQGVLNNISITAGQDANIRIPQGNSTLPPIGPVILGAAHTAHRVFLGQIDVSIELQDDTGKGVFGPIPVVSNYPSVEFAAPNMYLELRPAERQLCYCFYQRRQFFWSCSGTCRRLCSNLS